MRKVIRLHFTDQEYAQIKAAADRHGESVQDFIKFAIQKDPWVKRATRHTFATSSTMWADR